MAQFHRVLVVVVCLGAGAACSAISNDLPATTITAAVDTTAQTTNSDAPPSPTATRPATTSAVPTTAHATSSTAAPTTSRAPVPAEPGRIAYVEHFWDPHFFFEIFTMDPDGSEPRQLTSDGDLYLGTEPGVDEPQEVYSGSRSPRWHPDGQRVAFLYRAALDRYEVRIVDMDGSNLEVMFPDWSGSMFSWSPDGSQIAWGDGTTVWVANAEGREPRAVAHASSVEGDGGAGEVNTIWSVTWSPDGKHLAYIETNGEGHVAGQPFVTILDLESGERSSPECGIPLAQSIDWQPNRSTLLINTCDGPTAILGADATVLSELPFSSDSVTWSPHGREILYRTGSALSIFDVETDSDHVLLEDFGGSDIQWQPLPTESTNE